MTGRQTRWESGPDPGPGPADETELISLAIEPAGEYAADEIMVAAIRTAGGWRVFAQRCGESSESLTAMLRERVSEHGLVSIYDSEQALLQALTRWVVEHLDGTSKNGDRRDGADDSHGVILSYDEPHLGAGVLPVLRTRVAAHGLPWPFWGCSAVELQSIVEDRFTTQTQEDSGTSLGLPAACEVLSDDGHAAGWNALDPVESAAAARDAAVELRPEDLILHTMIDTYRVALLHRALRRYCPVADLQPEPIAPAKQTHLEHNS